MRRLTLLTPVLLCGCLTITNERPSFEELEGPERSAVETVLGELRAFEARIMATRGCSIKEIIDPEKINVSFEGLIIANNLGDNIIHLTIWENLSEPQRAMLQAWFGASSSAQASSHHQKLFYQFLAVTQAVKQFMYKALEVPWLMSHRSLFNVERDAVRTAVAHYDGAGRGAEMRGFLGQICGPLMAAEGEVWAPRFADGKAYLANPFNLAEFFNPEKPAGYLYFVCGWAKLATDPGASRAGTLGEELDWILSLRSRRCQAGNVVNIQ